MNWAEILRKSLTELTPPNMTQKQFEDEVNKISETLIKNNVIKDDTSTELIFEEIKKLIKEY